MNISKFLKLFSIKKSNELLDLYNNEEDFDSLFINKIKEFRYSFCQKMIDDGFTPSKSTIDQLQNILLAEISENATYHYKKRFIPINPRKLKGDIEDNSEQVISFISFMLDNNYLNYTFLKKSQNLNNYIDYKATIKNLIKKKNFVIFKSDIKLMRKSCSSFLLPTEWEKSLEDYSYGLFLLYKETDYNTHSMFSKCLNFKHYIDDININKESNVLKELIPDDYLKNAKDVIHEYMDIEGSRKKSKSNEDYLNLILICLVPSIITNEINTKKVTALEIIKDTLVSDTNFKELSNVIVTYYPEVMSELSKKDGLEVLKRINIHIKSCEIFNPHNNILLNNYIKKLTELLHENRESIELDNIKIKKQAKVFQSNDYIEHAKALGVPENLKDILIILKDDIESLRKTNINEYDEHTIKKLEIGLLKSLSMYAELVELDDNNKENISNYIEQPVLDMLKIIKEIKEANINDKLNDLMVNKKAISMKVR